MSESLQMELLLPSTKRNMKDAEERRMTPNHLNYSPVIQTILGILDFS